MTERALLDLVEQRPDFVEVRAGLVHDGETIGLNESTGTIQHQWSPLARTGPILGAWGLVTLRERPPVVAWVSRAEAQENTPAWKLMPGPLLEAKARLAALHRAYPGLGAALADKAQAPAEAAPPRKAPQPPPAARGLWAVSFGPCKGKLIKELSPSDLSSSIDLAIQKLAENPKARWVGEVRDNLALLEAEAQARSEMTEPGASPAELT